MFSATFPEEIQRLAGKFLSNYIFIAVGIVGGACTDVEQVIYDVKRYDKRKKLLEILNTSEPNGTLIFVETKRQADFLATFLSETQIPATSIHGDREQQQREQALADFKSLKMKILIATSVAARGLGNVYCKFVLVWNFIWVIIVSDIRNVAHVINFDLPKEIDEYVHRIGRTGRVGNSGKASSFYDSENVSGHHSTV